MRQHMPLAVGRGIQRDTGLVSVQPSQPVDARNIYARNAKMALRPGMSGTGYPDLEWGTDVLAVQPIKATLDILFCVYDRLSKQIRIYRLDTDNGVIQTLAAFGLWGTLAGTAYPVVTAAEANGLVFFAHDEADINVRLPTIYYTPDFATPANVGTITTLTADLDDTGPLIAVAFRGVCTHLEYMCGWGYGNGADPDRPDIFRMSDPADPLTWRSENFAVVGVKRDPIIGAVECVGQAMATGTGVVVPSVLAICKSDESYRLNGTSPEDFGIEVLDARFGVVSARCLINLGGSAYGWSSDGPRQWTPAGTQSISQPLELGSPFPVDFPALGPERLCFAAYDQEARILYFVWPDPEEGTFPIPAFLLSLWNPDDPRWTYATLEQLTTCAGRQILRDTGGPAIPPTGYVSDILADDVG